LRLHEKDKVRDTFYSEILDLVSAYEYGFAKVLEDAYEKKAATSPHGRAMKTMKRQN